MRIHLITGRAGAGKTQFLRSVLRALGDEPAEALAFVTAQAAQLEAALPLDAALVKLDDATGPEALAELLFGLADSTAYADAFVEVPATCELPALTTALDLNLARSSDGRVALAIGLWDARAPLGENRARCRLADLALVNHVDAVGAEQLARELSAAREATRRAVVVPVLRGELDVRGLVRGSADARWTLGVASSVGAALTCVRTSGEPLTAATRALPMALWSDASARPALRGLLTRGLERLQGAQARRIRSVRVDADASAHLDAEAVSALLEALPRGIFSARGTAWTAHGAVSVFARTRFHSVTPTVARETRLVFHGVDFEEEGLVRTLLAAARPAPESAAETDRARRS